LSQEQHVGIDEPLTDARIGRTSPTDCDDVLDVMAVLLQPTFESERKILVEEDSHDAWRTAAGR
jgi:hypothetical protein